MAHSDRQAHMAFIQRNLDFLLAAAWQGYRYDIPSQTSAQAVCLGGSVVGE